MTAAELLRSPRTRLGALATLPGLILLAGVFLTRPGPRTAIAAAPEMPVAEMDRAAGLIKLPAAATPPPPLGDGPPRQAAARGPSGPFRSIAAPSIEPVIDVTPESTEVVIPRCTAIIGGRVPLAIVDGRPYATGEILPGGWTLAGIDPVQREVLLRDHEGVVYRKRLEAPRLRE